MPHKTVDQMDSRLRESRVCFGCGHHFKEGEQEWAAEDVGKLCTDCIIALLVEVNCATSKILSHLNVRMHNDSFIKDSIADKNKGSAMDLKDIINVLVSARNSSMTLIQNVSFQAGLKRSNIKGPEIPEVSEEDE